ncbi:PAS domain S-box protein [Salinibaculum rarum]|uniref:PAS domain S-box protein n=1 Tax=Salinibaculum rarum TaxID=3058903 RepID=UPI00265DDA67|nr:PAS domain S-box protein [Salinibaculum sp. KK48]
MDRQETTGDRASSRATGDGNSSVTQSECDVLLETIDRPVFVYDVESEEAGIDFGFRRNNSAHERQTGITTEEFLGKSPRAILGEESGAALTGRFRECVERGEPLEYEQTVDYPAGRVEWDTTLTPVVDGGDVRRLVGVASERSETSGTADAPDWNRDRLDLFDTAPDGIVLHDETGEILDANETLADMLGYTQAELRSRAISDIEVGLEAESLREKWQSMESGQLQRLELSGTHRRKDGTTYPAEVWVRKVAREDDSSARFVAFIRDVTRRRRREQNLNLKTRAMDTAPIGVVITDPSQPDNPIVYANEQFEEVTGYSESDVVGRNCRFLQGEETSEASIAKMRDAIAAHEPVSVELRNYRKDGTEFWNRVEITPVRDSDGEVTHYVGFQQNVTERKEHEQRLELFREAVEQAGHGVVITDRNGTIEYVNPAYERDTGYTYDEAVGLTPRIIKSGKHDEEFYEQMWDTILDGDVWETELINRRKSGELYHVDQTIAPITDENGEITHFVGVESDINRRWLREQRLDVLNRILRHNLRNAITVVQGNASVLYDELEGEALRANVAAIQNRVERLQTLSEKVSTVRSVFQQEVDTETTCDIAALVADLEPEFDETYPDASISVSVPETAGRACRRVLIAQRSDLRCHLLVHG